MKEIKPEKNAFENRGISETKYFFVTFGQSGFGRRELNRNLFNQIVQNLIDWDFDEKLAGSCWTVWVWKSKENKTEFFLLGVHGRLGFRLKDWKWLFYNETTYTGLQFLMIDEIRRVVIVKQKFGKRYSSKLISLFVFKVC